MKGHKYPVSQWDRKGTWNVGGRTHAACRCELTLQFGPAFEWISSNFYAV